MLAGHGVKGGFEFIGVLYFQGLEIDAQCGRRTFHNAPVGTHHSIGRIPKDSQTGGFGNNVDEELRLFGGYVRGGIERYPSDVSPRMRQALNEALADRIACIDKDNGIDAVASLAAWVAIEAAATITSTLRRTNSAAETLSWSTLPEANRRSTRIFCPSVQPRLRNR